MFSSSCSFFMGGGPIVYVTFAFSVIAWIFIFQKIRTFKDSGAKCKRKHEETFIMVKEGRISEAFKACKNNCRLNNCSLFKILYNASRLKHYTHSEFDRAVSVSMIEEKNKLERFTGSISLIANLCPLLGLLGTVLGMISTFYIITIHGTGEPGLMGKGISQALITTQVGLFLAVPIVFFHEFINSKKQTVEGNMKLYVRKLKTVMCGENGLRD